MAADFGIARAATWADHTQVGVVKGKPGYLAPEQAAGESLDGRVDLFALGVTLREALTGARLFPTGDDPVSMNAVPVKRAAAGLFASAPTGLEATSVLACAIACSAARRASSGHSEGALGGPRQHCQHHPRRSW